MRSKCDFSDPSVTLSVMKTISSCGYDHALINLFTFGWLKSLRVLSSSITAFRSYLDILSTLIVCQVISQPTSLSKPEWITFTESELSIVLNLRKRLRGEILKDSNLGRAWRKFSSLRGKSGYYVDSICKNDNFYNIFG